MRISDWSSDVCSSDLLGFPVPATRMRTCVLDGLITTINLADNIGAGYSHFYTEVKRVKLVAERIQQTDRLLVIFDELFRGTNVKEAYERSAERRVGTECVRTSSTRW